MREEVLLLPPSAERRNSMTAKEESKDIFLSKWALSDQKTVEKFRHAITVNQGQTSEVRMDAEEAKKEEESAVHSLEPVKQENSHDEEDLAKDIMKNPGSSSVDQSSQAAPILHWGNGKRSRCSRMDSHHRKPCDLADMSCALSRKRQKVKADRIFVTPSNGSNLTHVLKSRVVRKGDHPWSPPFVAKEHVELRAKSSREVCPDLRHGKRFTEQRGHPNVFAQAKQDRPVHHHQSRKCTSADHKLASPDRCVMSPANENEAGPAKMEYSWPKFILPLSRKEKEKDFVIFKGSKLPQRPKRRPKAVEKALHYCTPGNWLADLSQSRYDVRVKKCLKKKPRGLKAMGSMDTDSE